MARDRKRAKQRQRRQQQQRPAAVPRDAELDLPQGGEIDLPQGGEIEYDAPEDDALAAPGPLAHSSADVDIAELAEASIQEPGAPEGPLEPEEYPQPDELEGAEVLDPHHEEAPVKGSRTAKPGAELPREGNRFVNFLRACVAELGRVQWPDRRHVGQATGVVLGFVVIAGSYLGLMDAVFSRLVNAIL